MSDLLRSDAPQYPISNFVQAGVISNTLSFPSPERCGLEMLFCDNECHLSRKVKSDHHLKVRTPLATLY